MILLMSISSIQAETPSHQINADVSNTLRLCDLALGECGKYVKIQQDLILNKDRLITKYRTKVKHQSKKIIDREMKQRYYGYGALGAFILGFIIGVKK